MNTNRINEMTKATVWYPVSKQCAAKTFFQVSVRRIVRESIFALLERYANSCMVGLSMFSHFTVGLLMYGILGCNMGGFSTLVRLTGSLRDHTCLID